MTQKSIVIMDAAGRDSHNFNCLFGSSPNFRVVAFTETQIPEVAEGLYLQSLAGQLYRCGTPIDRECDLVDLFGRMRVLRELKEANTPDMEQFLKARLT